MKNIIFLIFFVSYHLIQSATAGSIYGVNFSVEHNEGKCPKDYPILISVENRTLKDLKGFSVEISATKKSHSTVVYKMPGYSSDKIIKKFSSDAFCFPFNNGRKYPGREDQIEIDRNLNQLELMMKYGPDISNSLATERAVQRELFIRLDPKYKPNDLNIYISKQYTDFD